MLVNLATFSRRLFAIAPLSVALVVVAVQSVAAQMPCEPECQELKRVVYEESTADGHPPALSSRLAKGAYDRCMDDC